MMADLLEPHEWARLRTPEGKPGDPRLYVTVRVIQRAVRSFIDPQTNEYVIVSDTGTEWPIDLTVTDELERLEWVELRDVDVVRVTKQGHYWGERFARLNKARGRLAEDRFRAKRLVRAVLAARIVTPPAAPGVAGGPAADRHLPVPLVAVAADAGVPLRRFLAVGAGAAAGG